MYTHMILYVINYKNTLHTAVWYEYTYKFDDAADKKKYKKTTVMARRSNFELSFPADIRGGGGGVRDVLRTTYTTPDNIVLLN